MIKPITDPKTCKHEVKYHTGIGGSMCMQCLTVLSIDHQNKELLW